MKTNTILLITCLVCIALTVAMYTLLCDDWSLQLIIGLIVLSFCEIGISAILSLWKSMNIEKGAISIIILTFFAIFALWALFFPLTGGDDIFFFMGFIAILLLEAIIVGIASFAVSTAINKNQNINVQITHKQAEVHYLTPILMSMQNVLVSHGADEVAINIRTLTDRINAMPSSHFPNRYINNCIENLMVLVESLDNVCDKNKQLMEIKNKCSEITTYIKTL